MPHPPRDLPWTPLRKLLAQTPTSNPSTMIEKSNAVSINPPRNKDTLLPTCHLLHLQSSSKSSRCHLANIRLHRDDGHADDMELNVERMISKADDLVWIAERMITSNSSNNDKVATTAMESIREQ